MTKPIPRKLKKFLTPIEPNPIPQKPSISEIRRQIAHQTIQKNATATKQGFGTGARTPKGYKRNTVDARARKLIDLVWRSINASMPDLEILLYLAATALTDPIVFDKAAKAAPRFGRNKSFKRVLLIRPELLKEPTQDEIDNVLGEHAALAPSFKRTNPAYYDKLRWQAILYRMTPAEINLMRALQYNQAKEVFAKLAHKNIINHWENARLLKKEAKRTAKHTTRVRST